jgi:anthranilate synthase/aminodeoxychorismate synthase-like glutamine amidotransferase
VILLIDNYDSFTWNLVQRLGELNPSLEVGKDLLVIRNDKITPDQAQALNNGKGPTRIIISPGPCTPKESGVSPQIIQRFAGRVPILGVCLGHQTMADMDGMTVARHVIPMHGKTSPIHHDSRGLFAGLSNPFDATRYHSLVVLPETIPPPQPGQDSWQVSAWTDEVDSQTSQTRRVVMGLRRAWADPTKAMLEGVQFHPESFLTLEGPKLLKNFLLSPSPSGEGRGGAAERPSR